MNIDNVNFLPANNWYQSQGSGPIKAIAHAQNIDFKILPGYVIGNRATGEKNGYGNIKKTSIMVGA